MPADQHGRDRDEAHAELGPRGQVILREVHGGIALDVLVQPRASRAKLGPIHDGRLKVAVPAPPVDGEANAAVIELLAKQLGVPRSAVEVISGASSRRKTVRIATPRAVIEKLLAAC